MPADLFINVNNGQDLVCSCTVRNITIIIILSMPYVLNPFDPCFYLSTMWGWVQRVSGSHHQSMDYRVEGWNLCKMLCANVWAWLYCAKFTIMLYLPSVQINRDWESSDRTQELTDNINNSGAFSFWLYCLYWETSLPDAEKAMKKQMPSVNIKTRHNSIP